MLRLPTLILTLILTCSWMGTSHAEDIRLTTPFAVASIGTPTTNQQSSIWQLVRQLQQGIPVLSTSTLNHTQPTLSFLVSSANQKVGMNALLKF